MMQRTVIIQSPVPPRPPSGSDPQIVTQSAIDRAMSNLPMTAQQVGALQARRSELSTQLRSAEGRRRDVQRQLANSSAPQDRAGLEQRIGVLDARIMGLENDMADVGRQLSSPQAALATTRPQFNMSPMARSRLADSMVPITIVFTLFVLSPLALSISRAIWKRGSMSRQQASPADAQRLERMEQAMEAIAIEIERVSEGQRFMTRLLSEQRVSVPIGAGQQAKDPVRVPAKQPTPV
jgi:hypothetical protein